MGITFREAVAEVEMGLVAIRDECQRLAFDQPA